MKRISLQKYSWYENFSMATKLHGLCEKLKKNTFSFKKKDHADRKLSKYQVALKISWLLFGMKHQWHLSTEQQVACKEVQIFAPLEFLQYKTSCFPFVTVILLTVCMGATEVKSEPRKTEVVPYVCTDSSHESRPNRPTTQYSRRYGISTS